MLGVQLRFSLKQPTCQTFSIDLWGLVMLPMVRAYFGTFGILLGLLEFFPLEAEGGLEQSIEGAK